MISIRRVSCRLQKTSCPFHATRGVVARMSGEKSRPAFDNVVARKQTPTNSKESSAALERQSSMFEKIKSVFENFLRRPSTTKTEESQSVMSIVTGDKPKTIETLPSMNLQETFPMFKYNNLPPVSYYEDQDDDLIRRALERAFDEEKFYEVVKLHGEIMNKSHLLQSIDLFQNRFSDVSVGSYSKNISDEICKIICLRKDELTASECLPVLNFVVNLKVHAGDPVAIAICQRLRLKAKDLCFKELFACRKFLHTLQTTNIYLEAMKLAIMVLFQTQIRTNLPSYDYRTCYDALFFCIVMRADLETCDFVSEAALEVVPHFSTKMAISILKNAGRHQAAVKKLDSLKSVMRGCMDILANEPSLLDGQWLDQVLDGCFSHHVGSAAFFEACWKKAHDWPLTRVGLLFKASVQINFMTLDAAKRVVSMIVEKKDELSSENVEFFRNYADAIALTAIHYANNTVQKAKCKAAAETLCAADISVETHLKSRHLLRLLLSLAIVEVFPENLLQEVFRPEYQRKLKNKTARDLVFLQRELQLAQGAETSYKTLPEVEASVSGYLWLSRVTPRLSGIIEDMLGGSNFIRKHLLTPSGLRAGLAVALDSNGSPIFVKGDDFFNEIPPQSKVLVTVDMIEAMNIFASGLRKVIPFEKERQFSMQNLCVLVIDQKRMIQMSDADARRYVESAYNKALSTGPEYSVCKAFQKAAVA